MDAANTNSYHLFNQWQKIAGNTDYESSYYELSWACARRTNNKICVTQDLAGGFVIRHIRFQNSFKANPLYPTQEDLSFIVCFRYEVSATELPGFTLDNQGQLASAGILNVAILHKQSNLSSFRFAVLNYYRHPNVDYAFVPVFIRIGGVFKHFEDIEDENNQLWAFFDSKVDLTKKVLNPTECTGIDVKVVCSPFPTFSRTVSSIISPAYWPQNTVNNPQLIIYRE